MNIKETSVYKGVRTVYYGIKNLDKTIDNTRIGLSLRPFKDKHKGESCVIIGNGPSLRIEDLTRLHELGIPTFGCNRVNLAFEQTEWRPTYYFMSDEKLIAQYDGKLDGVPDQNRFFPKKYRDIIKNGIFYNELWFDYNNEGKFSTDASRGVFPAGSITTEMIQFAYYMGFSEIYLIGVDFSYATTNKNSDKTYVYSGENNYFVKGYLKEGEIAYTPNVKANLLGFHAAKDTIEANHRVIANATRGGKLEVFDRENLDDLFTRWEKK